MTPNLARRHSMILGLMLATVPSFCKTPVSTILVTVRVYDYVNLPATERGELIANAQRVLGQADVKLQFLDCLVDGVGSSSLTCTAPLRSTDLVLRILLPKLAVKSEQLGYAAQTAEGGAYITLFIDPAQGRARIASLSDGKFLGHAAAHEIGHLLLGANSHSSSGIMRSGWRQVDQEWMLKGALLFDKAQSRLMHSVLAEWASR